MVLGLRGSREMYPNSSSWSVISVFHGFANHIKDLLLNGGEIALVHVQPFKNVRGSHLTTSIETVFGDSLFIKHIFDEFESF